MEKLSFVVKVKMERKINWSLNSIQKFPTHEHYLFEIKEYVVEYEFKPTRTFDKVKFLNFMKVYLLKAYGGYEVLEIKN